MKNLVLVTNPSKDKGLFLTKKIKNHVERHGGHCAVFESRNEAGETGVIHKEDIGFEPEGAVILGGDGTFVRAARDLESLSLPMLGVNLGTLGYLCEVEEENVIDAVNRLLIGDYLVEKRLKLFGEAVSGNKRIPMHSALNDIVIHRSGAMQIVSLNLYVNGKFLCNYSADGVVISTPTGSTAYNLSAGGPVVDPKAKLILVTPVCPQGITLKSMIIDVNDEIAVEVLQRNTNRDKEKVEVSFDGDFNQKVSAGDVIVVHKDQTETECIKLSELSFIERMHKKMIR